MHWSKNDNGATRRNIVFSCRSLLEVATWLSSPWRLGRVRGCVGAMVSKFLSILLQGYGYSEHFTTLVAAKCACQQDWHPSPSNPNGSYQHLKENAVGSFIDIPCWCSIHSKRLENTQQVCEKDPPPIFWTSHQSPAQPSPSPSGQHLCHCRVLSAMLQSSQLLAEIQRVQRSKGPWSCSTNIRRIGQRTSKPMKLPYDWGNTH